MVRATLRMRSYARAESPSRVSAARISPWPAASSAQCRRTIGVVSWALQNPRTGPPGGRSAAKRAAWRARAVGVMQMKDEKGLDDKIIAVHLDDPAYRHYSHIRELPPHSLLELKRFFEDYKLLENKEVRVSEFQGPYEALKIIRDGIEGYKRLQAAGGEKAK